MRLDRSIFVLTMFCANLQAFTLGEKIPNELINKLSQRFHFDCRLNREYIFPEGTFTKEEKPVYYDCNSKKATLLFSFTNTGGQEQLKSVSFTPSGLAGVTLISEKGKVELIELLLSITKKDLQLSCVNSNVQITRHTTALKCFSKAIPNQKTSITLLSTKISEEHTTRSSEPMMVNIYLDRVNKSN